MSSEFRWRKSSRSSGQGGACVELADLAMAVGVRDSKDPNGPKLLLTRAAFADVVTRIKAVHQR
ncbi:DUF397 domain-containing protein [Actinomadura adrarensis]|uniref:DUF397 domain-containing protein n=1 Tax=Actinomadura adrarensis TaxID=1819600 RepID=A0ABW3CTB6_9ACTN